MPRDKTHSYILLIIILWFTLLYFPGSYSVDSWAQFAQVTHWEFTDWHDPIYSVIWKILMLPTGQFFSMYLLQMVLYTYFVYQLLIRLNKNSTVYWAGLFLVVFYAFIPQYVMKDALHAIVWAIAGLYFIIHAEEEKRSAGLATAMFLLILTGLLIRVNSIIGFLPLIWIWTMSYVPKVRGVFLRAVTVLAIAGACMIANNVLTYNILRAEHAYPQYKIMLLDVIGISKLTGKNYIPRCIQSYPDYNHDSVMSQYKPYTIDHIYWPTGHSPHMIPYPNKRLNNCLLVSWKDAITRHPLEYVQNRLEGYLYYLRIKTHAFEDGGNYWDAGVWIDPDNPFKLRHYNPGYLRRATGPYFGLIGTFIFAPWFFLLLNAAGVVYFFARYKKYKRGVYAVLGHIQLSGLLYLLSFFVVFQNDRDFRFTHWNVFVALIGLIYLWHDRYRKGDTTGH